MLTAVKLIKDTYRVDEVAELLDVTKRTVFRYIKANILATVNRQPMRITRASLEKCLTPTDGRKP